MSSSPSVTLRWSQRRSLLPWVLAAQLAAFVATVVGWSDPETMTAIIAATALGTWLDYFRAAKGRVGQAALTVTDGRLALRSGSKTWVLRAKDVTGASSARGEHGWDLSVQLRGALPITLEGLDHDTTQRVCAALGIGWAGVGVLTFRDARPFGVALIYALLLFTTILPITAAQEGVAAYWFTAVMLSLWTLTLFGWNRIKRAPVFTMADAGMTFSTRVGRVGVAWNALTWIEEVQGHLHIFVRGSVAPLILPIRKTPHMQAVTPYEASVITQHVRAAIERAQGLGRRRRLDVADELLDKGSRSTAEWHAQLDLMAAEIGGGSGYRTHQLSLEQLHDVLQNPDAAAFARIGAARIVARIEGDAARARIDVFRGSLREAEHEDALHEALEQAKRSRFLR